MPTRVGALFMEMGTGKTRAAIELVHRRRSRIDHAVIFCPVSLKETWRYEIVKHTDAAPADIYVFDDRTSSRNLPAAFWYVIGLESMSSSNRVTLAAHELVTESSYVVVDESSYIKGHNARRTQRITTLAARARYRLLLTGTPLSQGIVDLFAQMRFLSPSILGYHSFYSFAANHLEYSERHPGLVVAAHNVPHLAAKIQPYVYQVSKAECIDLPDKLYESRYYTMTVAQRDAYEQAKYDLLLNVPDDEITSYTLFKLFTVLQQIVAGFVNEGRRVMNLPHKRLEQLDAALASIPAAAKVIIWCKYLYSLDVIANRLTTTHGAGTVAVYHGGLDEHNRHVEIERFRQSARFLIATQATGGHGLTINEAHHVIFYENGFKYAERAQAEDRCHRIGQTQPVTYIDIVCRDSIDERIQSSLAGKGNVVEAFRLQVKRIKDSKDKAALAALVLEL